MSPDRPVRPSPIAARLRMHVLESRYEFVKLLRTPHYAVPILAFPVMFYLLFGVSFHGSAPGAQNASQYLLAGYAVFGMVTAALMAFGVGVAHERAQGWLLLKRTTPMPIGVYLTAKVMASMLFAATIVVTLAVCGVLLGGVRVPVTSWLTLLGVILAGCVPFCLAGLLMAMVVPPVGAPGIVNLFNLPLAFASGLWMPVEMLPRFFQAIAPFLPQYHVAKLAIGSMGAADAGGMGRHLGVLALFAIGLGIATRIAWRRSDTTGG
jgi:ABC-2 type transport system permease protein